MTAVIVAGVLTQEILGVIEQPSLTVGVISQGLTIVKNEYNGSSPPVTVDFTVASAEWQVLHNRGQKPVVDVLDEFGEKIATVVRHLSVNEFRVYFSSPTKGSAIYY